MENRAVDDRPGSGSKSAQPQSAVRRGRMALRGKKAGIIGRVVAVLAMVAGFSVLVVPQASADGGSDFLRNWETGRCLDSDGTGLVYTNACQANNWYQQWFMVVVPGSDGNDQASFQNRATGQYLVNDDGLRTRMVAPFYWTGEGPSWQQVRLRRGLYCVDSNYAGNAYLHTCNGGGFQKWKYGY